MKNVQLVYTLNLGPLNMARFSSKYGREISVNENVLYPCCVLDINFMCVVLSIPMFSIFTWKET